MAATMHDLLTIMIERGASDLHITTGTPPQIRLHGKLTPLTQFERLTPQDTQRLAYSVLNEGQKQKFEEDNELDLSFGIQGLARFRCNVYRQPGAVASAIRVIPIKIRSFDELGLPAIVEHPADLPIAETGRRTLGTLPTNSCAQTINRIIDVFPTSQQSQVRAQLSLVLEGVLSQQLIPTADGRGRVMALEIMVTTPAIRNLIREEKIHQIYSAMQAGQKFGMQTMNQSLIELVQKRQISREEALNRSMQPEELAPLAAVTAVGPATSSLTCGP